MLITFERDADLRADITEQTVRKYLDIKPLIRRGIKEAFAGEKLTELAAASR